MDSCRKMCEMKVSDVEKIKKLFIILGIDCPVGFILDPNQFKELRCEIIHTLQNSVIYPNEEQRMYDPKAPFCYSGILFALDPREA